MLADWASWLDAVVRHTVRENSAIYKITRKFTILGNFTAKVKLFIVFNFVSYFIYNPKMKSFISSHATDD